MKTVLITGGTGLVGKALTRFLQKKGYKVIVLSRSHSTSGSQSAYSTTIENNIEYALWNPEKTQIDLTALQKADYIIHLAGAGVVDKKWTEKYKKTIRSSRTESSKILIDSLKKHLNKVKAIISASAIGWYGDESHIPYPENSFTETDKPDKGFLGETCRLWEESIQPATSLSIRLVKLRTGIVLSTDGGALPEFAKSLKFGIASILGTGKQMISWIHIDDLCRIFIAAIENENYTGVYNAVSPQPVSNRYLILQLAKKIRGRFFIPVHIPAFFIKLLLGERSIEVLKSTPVSSEKIQKTGFTFLYPSVESAFNELYSK